LAYIAMRALRYMVQSVLLSGYFTSKFG